MLVIDNANSITFNQKIENKDKKYDSLNFLINKKEDDIKNLLTEKDIIIQELNEKLLIQENQIKENKQEIYLLNDKLNTFINQFNKFKFIMENKENIKEKPIEIQSCNEEEENTNEDIISNDIGEDDLKEEDNLNEGVNYVKEYVLIGENIEPLNESNNILDIQKNYSFKSNIIKFNDQFYALKKGLDKFFPNFPLTTRYKLNLDYIDNSQLDITELKQNSKLLNKNLLFVVQTSEYDIICLYFNKSKLPIKSFYLLVNENKIFYYKEKEEADENIENEIYRSKNDHKGNIFSNTIVKNTEELKQFLLDGYFNSIPKLKISRINEIEIFEIL
jgi:hypothetical protein